ERFPNNKFEGKEKKKEEEVRHSRIEYLRHSSRNGATCPDSLISVILVAGLLSKPFGGVLRSQVRLSFNVQMGGDPSRSSVTSQQKGPLKPHPENVEFEIS
ncbi:hypothetical protein CEXT_323761, partial [Caerostris extrusa]